MRTILLIVMMGIQNCFAGIGPILYTDSQARKAVWGDANGIPYREPNGTTRPAVAGTDYLKNETDPSATDLVNAIKLRNDGNSIIIGIDSSLPANEFDAIEINTPHIGDNVGRGLNVFTHYTGPYGATGIQTMIFYEGPNSLNHGYSQQSWLVYNRQNNVSGFLAPYMAKYTIQDGNIPNIVAGLYCPGGDVTGGSVANYWGGIYSVSGDPSYLRGGLVISDYNLANAAIKSPFEIRKPYNVSSYGLTTPQAAIYSNSNFAVGAGGVLALGGKENVAGTTYNFAFVAGTPESASTYGGNYEVWTTAGASVDSETASGNYKRMIFSARGYGEIAKRLSVGKPLGIDPVCTFEVVGDTNMTGDVNTLGAFIRSDPNIDHSTSLYLDVNDGNSVRRLQVCLGDANSGGEGYRLLRVSN